MGYNRRADDAKIAAIDVNLRNMISIVNGVSSKVDKLWDAHNQRKGFMILGRTIAGAVGALIVLIADHYSSWAK